MRRHAVPPPLVLVALWAGLYLPALLTGATLPARDVAATQIPWRTVWRSEVLAGQAPLWDPLSNSGRPLLANPNAMAAYPGTALFLLTTPERAAAWHLALHHLLLLLGCYVLARRSGLRRGAATVGAAAAGAGGVAFSMLTFLNAQAALAWAPWALATAVPAPEGTPARWRRALAGGVLVGLVFLAGEPVTAALTGLAWGAVALASWRPRPWREVAVAGLAAAAAAGPVLLPLLAVFRETARGALGVAPGALAADALAPRRWPELLLPNLLGPPLADAAGGFWAAASFPWQRYYPVIFTGSLPWLLLPFARRRRLAAWWVLALGGTAAALACGVPAAARALAAVPLLGGARFGIKFLILPTLALPVLAGAGWEGLAAAWRGAGRRAARGAAAAVAALLLAACLPDTLVRPALRTLYPASAPALASVPAARLRRAALADVAALAAPLAVVLAAGPAPLLAAGATLASGALAGRGLLAFEDARLWARPPRAAAAIPAGARLAAFAEAGSPATPPAHAVLARFAASRAALVAGYGTRWGFGYALVRGPDGLEPVREELLAAAAAHLPEPERARVARAVGAGAVLRGGSSAGAPEDGGRAVRVEVVSPPPPAAYLARRLLPAEGWAAVAATLGSPAFVPGEDAVVEGGGGARPAAGGTVTERDGAPARRRFAVRADGATVLVVQQSYMGGWRARVDGAAAPVIPVNGAMMGVPVPGGRHTVTVFLDPGPYRAGAAALALVLVLLAACGLTGSRDAVAAAGTRPEEPRLRGGTAFSASPEGSWPDPAAPTDGGARSSRATAPVR